MIGEVGYFIDHADEEFAIAIPISYIRSSLVRWAMAPSFMAKILPRAYDSKSTREPPTHNIVEISNQETKEREH